MPRKQFPLKRLMVVCAILLGLAALATYPCYLVARSQFNRYFERWGDKLVDLDKRGLLSTEFGAAWKDIIQSDAMETHANHLAPSQGADTTAIRMVDGVCVDDYPSLSIIRRLNEVHKYSNTIEITDRHARLIAQIRTDHTRAAIVEVPATLRTALLAAEDDRFAENRLGFEFDSYVRAILRAAAKSARTLHLSSPGGTSTITQQVAKLFISDVDREGRRYVSRSVDRKVREMRLAAAMRAMYAPDEILEVYVNHCVTSDYGLIGYKDIAQGLFGVPLSGLSDAQCIYLARMVKWGRNVRPKIIRQCHVDMPRMARALGWDAVRQAQVLREVDSLVFRKPKQIETEHGALVDLANHYWLLAAVRNGIPAEEAADLDIIDPNSLIRKKGNLSIQLTIDLPLQEQVERLVKTRGYGPDTAIVTDVRIGSSSGVVTARRQPTDTVRHIEPVVGERTFSEPGSDFTTTLIDGDSLVTNVRYQKVKAGAYRRSVFHYVRRPIKRSGQYFAYALLDSKTGELLAYYSRDQIGSKLISLLGNRIPNGSSTAKPIMNALNFDIGTFQPYSSWLDSVEVTDDVPWKRSFAIEKGRTTGVVFAHSAVKGRGYVVHNHGGIFEGCQYVFDLLASSNNILGVESVYRLNNKLFDFWGNIAREGTGLAQLFQRIDAFGRVKNDLKLKYVTGVRVYKELARIVGVDTDSMAQFGKRIGVSDSLYSVALGTLELNLMEQVHLFNVLYNNDLIYRPAEHSSLAVKLIVLRDDTLAIADTVKRYHPFADVNNIRPTHLGLHKRLVGNRGDGLSDFDVGIEDTSALPDTSESTFSTDAFYHDGPLSNYAKSGTTDDVLTPFDADPVSKRVTNYGLWNAVVRLDLARLASPGDSVADVHDVTVACVGECSTKYTGVRDGKTLHKFLTMGLLHSAGVKDPAGYFAQYEQYLKRTTPADQRNCGSPIPVGAAAPEGTERQAGD